MSSDEEVSTFYLILKPVPETITISTVMRCLINKQFPVKKIKRISNKVCGEDCWIAACNLMNVGWVAWDVCQNWS